MHFALASTPRFIKNNSYYDVVALAPAKDRTRDHIRDAIVKSTNEAFGDIKLGFPIPDTIKAIAPLATPFNASVHFGLMICSQGLGPKRKLASRNPPLPPFEVGLFMEKGYFERLVAQSLQERQVVLSTTTFDAGLIKIDCYYTDRTTLSNGTNGYIDLRIDWKYSITFEEPVDNVWVINARQIRAGYETSGICAGLLCDFFHNQIIEQAERAIEASQLVTFRLVDLSSVATSSRVYANSDGLLIDITEVPK